MALQDTPSVSIDTGSLVTTDVPLSRRANSRSPSRC